MWTAEFRDLVTGSNSSGFQHVCYGPRRVYVDVIPADRPTDWTMGPKMVPGEYGVFLEHLWYPAKHGPYAIATAKTAEEAMKSAGGQFVAVPMTGPDGKVRPASQQPVWEEVHSNPEEDASLPSRRP